MPLKHRKNGFSVGKGINKIQHLLGKYKPFRKKVGKFARKVIPVLIKKNKKCEEFKHPLSKQICSRSRVVSFKKDDVVLGRLLGIGGFGSVYMGTYKSNNVAVKVLHKVTKNPPAQLESFKAELNTVGFDHPNIVQTLTATPISAFEMGAWIVMEYAGHRTLHSLIDDSSVSLGPSRRIKFSFQIADALKYAHDNKIVHLDLKPANIIITPDGNCKLADFGCSQKLETDMGIASPTQRSALTGTFAYRAPELLRGEAPSNKADIYALGLVIWEICRRCATNGQFILHMYYICITVTG